MPSEKSQKLKAFWSISIIVQMGKSVNFVFYTQSNICKITLEICVVGLYETSEFGV